MGERDVDCVERREINVKRPPSSSYGHLLVISLDRASMPQDKWGSVVRLEGWSCDLLETSSLTYLAVHAGCPLAETLVGC